MFQPLSEGRKAENKKLYNFVLEKCETADKPLNLKNLVDEFVANEGTITPAASLFHFVSIHKATELVGMECTETKIRRWFALGLPIHQFLFVNLRKHAIVKLDKSRHITRYEAFDRTLILSGDHCAQSKKRETMAERRRSQMADDGAENEDEEEEDDGNHLEMAMDPELQPPAPKRPRVANVEVKIEEPELQEDIKQEPVESGNFSGLEDVKQENPEPVMENFEVKEGQDVKPDITSSSDPAQSSVLPSASNNRDQENSHQQEQQSENKEASMKPMLTIATQLELLKSLEAIIGFMDLPMDPSKIKNQIQKISAENGGEKLMDVKIEDVRKTIDYAVVVAKLDRTSEGETRSLKEFLKLVQFTVVKDRFEEIEKELKEELETFKTKDMLVPVLNITKAMEAMVDILVSN